MVFKKVSGKICGVALDAREQKAMDEEIRKTVSQQAREYEQDSEAAILWMLHVHFGFGAKRLKKAWQLFYVEQQKLREYYELPKEDGPWLCREKLRTVCGVDLEQWYREEEESKKNENR